MTFLRKLEIVAGVATAILGIAAAAQMLHTDMETMRRLGRSFPVFQELVGASLLYIVPGLLVALGSYFHVTKVRSWGFPMTIISSLFLLAIFVSFVFVPVYLKPNLTFWIDFLLALFAITTIALCLGVRLEDSK